MSIIFNESLKNSAPSNIIILEIIQSINENKLKDRLK